jgi:hypothetical protein
MQRAAPTDERTEDELRRSLKTTCHKNKEASHESTMVMLAADSLDSGKNPARQVRESRSPSLLTEAR